MGYLVLVLFLGEDVHEFSQFLGNFVVEADTLGPDSILSQYLVGSREPSEELLSLSGFDGCGVDLVGIIVIQYKKVFVSPS